MRLLDDSHRVRRTIGIGAGAVFALVTLTCTAAAVDPQPPSSQWSPPGEPLPPPSDQTDEALPATGDWVLSDDLLADAPAWYEPSYWLDPPPWDGGIELGLNGSSGTSDSLSLRTGGYIKLESRFSKLDFSGYYNRTTSSGVITQNNADMDLRNDWLLDETSPWTLFALGSLFYDQFQAFDWQANANSGVGYRVINQPDIKLTGRVGGGASREFGGPDDEWVPEALFGFDYEQCLTAIQKFYGKLEYFPEFEEFGQYRLVADAGWEIELLQPANVSLVLSANDRFDSTPNGAQPHLVNYSVLLLFKL